jgi:hypothetical protein
MLQNPYGDPLVGLSHLFFTENSWDNNYTKAPKPVFKPLLDSIVHNVFCTDI